MKTSLSPEEDKGSGIFVNRANAIESCPIGVSELCHYCGHHGIVIGIFKAEGHCTHYSYCMNCFLGTYTGVP